MKNFKKIYETLNTDNNSKKVNEGNDRILSLHQFIETAIMDGFRKMGFNEVDAKRAFELNYDEIMLDAKPELQEIVKQAAMTKARFIQTTGKRR